MPDNLPDVSPAPEHPESTPPPSAQNEDPRVARRRVITFVTVFVVAVVVTLAGYRYAIPTVANDRYLFQVASHTAWMLQFVGYSCELGDLDLINDSPEVVRARIAAWQEGKEAPETIAPANPPAPPLTPWEARLYQALKERKDNPKEAAESGPLVAFVWKPGISIYLREATRELERVRRDPALDDETRKTQRAAAETRVASLRKEMEEAHKNNEPPAKVRGVSFPFTVVPDCGAIPSMSIFFAAVLAFPTKLWKRFLGILLGLPILYFVNCLRLACLALIGAWDFSNGYEGKWFNFAHHYIWQGIYIVFVVAVWMAWVELIVRGSERWQRKDVFEA